jgi:uncharacterized membrane protein YuzA (DUF378 family)
MEAIMKTLNLVTLILAIIGGLNWGLVGLAHVDVVAALFGVDTAVTRIVYVIVGLSALWQIVPLSKAFATNEVSSEANAVR